MNVFVHDCFKFDIQKVWSHDIAQAAVSIYMCQHGCSLPYKNLAFSYNIHPVHVYLAVSDFIEMTWTTPFIRSPHTRSTRLLQPCNKAVTNQYSWELVFMCSLNTVQ